eukprot:SAG25_NODE_3697_length_995_cov_1.584821_2_plen_90_part_00
MARTRAFVQALDAVTWHHYYTAGRGGVVSTAEYLDPSFLDGYVQVAQLAQSDVARFRARTGTPQPMLWCECCTACSIHATTTADECTCR